MKKSIKKSLFGVSAGILGLGTVVSLPIALVSCAQEPAKKETTTQSNWDKFQVVKYLANVWNTQSAEKNAMTENAYNSAEVAFIAMTTGQSSVFDINKVTVPGVQKVGTTEYCTVANADSTKAIPVVFMDIDETIINNFAFQNYCLLNDVCYSDQLWHEYVLEGPQPALKGAIEFIKFVWAHGGVVMFNSNRLQKTELEATKQVLVKVGLEEKYMPDWIWWMQGIQLKDESGQPNMQPWDVSKSIDTSIKENKKFKTTKEDRMNFLNDNKFDLSKINSANGAAVQFKTVMRVGDSFSDFNDNATGKMSNADRIDFLEKNTKDLFGNFNVNVKGKRVVKNTDTSAPTPYTISDESWSESYVMIGGNTAYGAFESGIKDGWFKLSVKEKQKAIEAVLKGLYWDPTVKN